MYYNFIAFETLCLDSLLVHLIANPFIVIRSIGPMTSNTRCIDRGHRVHIFVSSIPSVIYFKLSNVEGIKRSMWISVATEASTDFSGLFNSPDRCRDVRGDVIQKYS